MSLATGAFGFPAASPTFQQFSPFTANTFNNQPSFGNPKFQWQQNNRLESLMQENQNPESLWAMIQENSEKLQQPFGVDGQEQGLPWQQDQGRQQGQSNNDNKTGGDGEKKSWLEELFEKQSEQGTGSDKEDSRKEKEEEWREQFEEMQEQYEEYRQEIQENRKTKLTDIQLFALLLIPFHLFDYPTAKYFASAELLSFVLTKLGINDDDNLLFLLFVQCVDIIALSRGRFKLVEGYQQNWYQELFDYMMTKMNYNDMIRLGAQMLMPQSPAPEYEEK